MLSAHRCIVAGGVVTFCLTGFYLAQRNGLFGKLVRMLRRFAGKRDLVEADQPGRRHRSRRAGCLRTPGQGRRELFSEPRRVG